MTSPESIIELHVDRITHLFDALDPFPFPERDLDKKVEDYIFSWARELPVNSAIKIVIHTPPDEFRIMSAEALSNALKRYFIYRAKTIGRDLSELFRVGRLSLAIGLAVMIVCVVASRSLTTIVGLGNVSRIFEEGLIILGWVANWRPIEIFLYDWWPLARRRDLYRRLALAKIELRAASVNVGLHTAPL